jgi:hypothetical protein
LIAVRHLESDSGSKAHQPLTPDRRVDLPEGRAAKSAIRVDEVRTVGHIERVDPDLGANPLGKAGSA